MVFKKKEKKKKKGLHQNWDRFFVQFRKFRHLRGAVFLWGGLFSIFHKKSASKALKTCDFAYFASQWGWLEPPPPPPWLRYCMYVITTNLLQLRKHQYLKRLIYFWVKVGRNHRRDVNHLPFLQNSKKCFGTRLIDKFSFRISTRRIIFVVEGRECDKQIDCFRAIRAGTELYRSWILYVIVL